MKALFGALLVVVLGLTACGGSGGGGSSSGSTVTTGTGETNTGSVSANFVPGAVPRYMIVRNSGYSIGSATPIVQSASGAITTLGPYTLSGVDVRIREIAGDASFALGRWVYGTVNDNGTPVDTLAGSATIPNWHYLIYNELSALPGATINTTCDSGEYSMPSYLSSSVPSSTLTATTTGSATLAFAGGIATINVSLLSTAGGASNTLNASSISWSSIHGISGAGTFYSGSGTWVTVSDGGGGSYRIVGMYTTVLSNGVHYQGVYAFKCTPV